jgi:hypothetical protein
MSLRAIGRQIGVDQRQVQRWLAGGDQPAPKEITGLDGRRYRLGKASAPEVSPATADVWRRGLLPADFHDMARELEIQKGALTELFRVIRRVEKRANTGQSLTNGEWRELYNRVGQEELIRAGLWDLEPYEDGLPVDHRLAELIGALMDFLTPAGLKWLIGDQTPCCPAPAVREDAATADEQGTSAPAGDRTTADE